MSFIKNPGSTVVFNPFNTVYYHARHYQTYIGLEKDQGCTVYFDYSLNDGECFIAECPYPSYRITEYNILLKPDPAVYYGSGMLWSGDGYYMFINHREELIITREVMPCEYLDPEDTFLEKEYWLLTQAWAGTLSERSFTGRHYKDEEKNITVVKEFPRWNRRHDGSGTWQRDNLPCGYYDPVDGAEGTLRIGTPPAPNGPVKYNGKESTVIAYICEAMTWKH